MLKPKHLIFILTIVGVASACSSNPNREDIIGNWKLIKTSDHFFEEDIQRLVFYPENDFLIPDDIYNDSNLEGKWLLEGKNISIDYYEGTGTNFYVKDFTDTSLTLIEDAGTVASITYLFKRIPFEKSRIDTLYFGTYFIENENDDHINVEITDADSGEKMEYVTNLGEYFIIVKPTKLKGYSVSARVLGNGYLKNTAVKYQFELFVEHSDSTQILEIEVSYNLRNDSIYALRKDWLDESKTSIEENLSLFDGKEIFGVKIKNDR